MCAARIELRLGAQVLQGERPIGAFQDLEEPDAGVDRLDTAAFALAHCTNANELVYGQYRRFGGAVQGRACGVISALAMPHRVTLKPSGHSFEVADGKTVLQAGLDAGYELPYSCREGVCRTCRATVKEGSVDYGHVAARYLPEEDKAKGFALLCQAKRFR